MQTCVYHVLRYTPNLVRDEWVNIGVLIHDPASNRARARLIEDLDEFARVRKLHPDADERLLRTLQADFEAQFSRPSEEVARYIATLDQTLSNVLQLSPQKGVLTEDLDAELDRLYRDHVEPPRFHRAAGEFADTRNAIRERINQVFRSAGIWSKVEKRVRAGEFTYPGDPLQLDYSYRSNGTRGFIHALSLARDPGLAKVLSYTAERIRSKLTNAEFTAVTKTRPLPESHRHQFVVQTLGEQGIRLVPVAEIEDFANRLRPTIH